MASGIFCLKGISYKTEFDHRHQIDTSWSCLHCTVGHTVSKPMLLVMESWWREHSMWKNLERLETCQEQVLLVQSHGDDMKDVGNLMWAEKSVR